MFDHGIEQTQKHAHQHFHGIHHVCTLKVDQKLFRSYHYILEGFQPQRSMDPRSMGPRSMDLRSFIHSCIHSLNSLSVRVLYVVPKQLAWKDPIYSS